MNSGKFINKLNKYLVATLTISLCGELYFYPFQGEFRFSAGVLAIGLILILYDDVKEIHLAFLAGLSVLILRISIDSLSEFNEILDLLFINIPGAIYYISYGVLFHIFNIRILKKQAIKTIYLLAMTDISSNVLEALIRRNLDQDLIRYILLVAIIRSIIIYTIYFVFKRQENIIVKKEHQKRYNQLNTLISNIQAEVFYLTKSTTDIEKVMTKAYKLYENTKGNKEVNLLALDVAREVHEIKKDYYRVLNGFKSYTDNFDINNSMYLKEIGSILQSNLDRYIEYLNKQIDVKINFNDDIKVKNYYYLFSIINNLITNAIDSILETGSIKVEGKLDGENYIFRVTDNGSGIEEDLLPYIFNPGFTTKYDLQTGNPSTGIGLSHVKNIVESLNGRLDVMSKENQGTSFTITIPLEEMREGS